MNPSATCKLKLKEGKVGNLAMFLGFLQGFSCSLSLCVCAAQVSFLVAGFAETVRYW
jgi:hypothetical protein